ncbi:MAG: MoaD/ThiS family protein [Alphaproteobacteria bacterium]
MARIVLSEDFGRQFTGGKTHFELQVSSVRQTVRALDAMFPGAGKKLGACAVAIDGRIIATPLLEKIKPDSEVYFLPAIRGGNTDW